MPPDTSFVRPPSPPSRWSPEARSTTRLALVACSLIATVGVLLIITLQAQRAEVVQDDAAAQTLRDYSGYAGRMLGAEVLRRFAEQRAMILAPVTGSSGRKVPAPALAEIERLGAEYFGEMEPAGDSTLAYFRIDAATGKVERTGTLDGALIDEIADTARAVVAAGPWTPNRNVLVVRRAGVPHSVALTPLLDEKGKVTAIYGYTYNRARAMTAVAARVFRETPLLPSSYAGARWDYDTVWSRSSGPRNEAFLAARVTDRLGNRLWASDNAKIIDASPYREQITIRTSPGGMIIETAMAVASEQSLVPTVVRRAQRWSTRGLIALTVLLLIVSLIALRGERIGARERREEALEQLALGLRHEINNALASVLLNAELLAEEEQETSRKERIDAMIEQLDRMRGVLRKLEKIDGLDVVPYLNEGFMIDLSVGEGVSGVVPPTPSRSNFTI